MDSGYNKRIIAGAETLDQALSDAQVQKLVTLLTELQRWNRRINLTAIRDVNEMEILSLARPYPKRVDKSRLPELRDL